MKKIIALALALIHVFSSGVVAFATEKTKEEIVIPERPFIVDENGFCVTYDEFCAYLLALVGGECKKYNLPKDKRLKNAEFRDSVEHIDTELAEENAHRYLFVDGKYSGVFVAAHNSDDSKVTGESSFQQVDVVVDKEGKTSDSISISLTMESALLYMTVGSLTDDADYSSILKTLSIFYDKPDTMIPFGKENPLEGLMISDPAELIIREIAAYSA